MTGELTISEAARASGLSAGTIRYYERAGVLPPVPRSGNRYRGYSAGHVETLRFARRLRDLGLGHADMAALIRTFHDGTCSEMRESLLTGARATLERLHAQRAELERMEAQLGAVVRGLEQLEPHGHRISTLEPCGCVDVVVLQEAT